MLTSHGSATELRPLMFVLVCVCKRMHALAYVGVCVYLSGKGRGWGRAKPKDNVQEPQLLKGKITQSGLEPAVHRLISKNTPDRWAKPTRRVMRLWPSVHAIVLNNSDNRFITGKQWIILLCIASRWQFYDLLCPLRM